MPAPLALLERLADGRFHSGGELGEALGVARTTLWTYVRELEALGLDIYAVRGRGYRLAEPLERLDAQAIRAALPVSPCAQPWQVHVLDCVDSTNDWLRKNADGMANGTCCLAEQQSAGRGRRGRGWASPFGRNLYLSLLWRIPMRHVSGLSIAAGVAVAHARLGRGEVLGRGQAAGGGVVVEAQQADHPERQTAHGAHAAEGDTAAEVSASSGLGYLTLGQPLTHQDQR